jgi:predicted nucleic acid-binding protein
VIFVDSSVWIDYFNGCHSKQTDWLDNVLGRKLLIIGDLVLTEVLQGFRVDHDYRMAKKLLTSLKVLSLLDKDLAVRSAENFRFLRKRGITVRKTNDVIIATFCIEKKFHLLHSDRGFLPFVEHLGLTVIE